METKDQRNHNEFMDLGKAQRLGLVHEINRRVLHPAGFSLVVFEDEEQGPTSMCFRDDRDDPEGFIFDRVNIMKALTFRKIASERAPKREEALGYLVQPVSSDDPIYDQDIDVNLLQESLDVLSDDLDEELSFVEGGWIDQIILTHMQDKIAKSLSHVRNTKVDQMSADDAKVSCVAELEGILAYFKTLRMNFSPSKP